MKHLNTSFINNYDRQFLFNQQLHNKRNICTKSAAFDFRTVYTGVCFTTHHGFYKHWRVWE